MLLLANKVPTNMLMPFAIWVAVDTISTGLLCAMPLSSTVTAYNLSPSGSSAIKASTKAEIGETTMARDFIALEPLLSPLSSTFLNVFIQSAFSPNMMFPKVLIDVAMVFATSTTLTIGAFSLILPFSSMEIFLSIPGPAD